MWGVSERRRARRAARRGSPGGGTGEAWNAREKRGGIGARHAAGARRSGTARGWLPARADDEVVEGGEVNLGGEREGKIGRAHV